MRKRRTKLGLSLADVAKRLTEAGIARTGAAIGNWEANDHVPLLANPDEARILADILDLPLADMLIAAGYDLDLQLDDYDVPSSLRPFLDNYLDLTRQEQNALSRILETLSDEIIDLRHQHDETTT